MTLKISSSAFKHEHEIPQIYTCQGQNISPEIKWTGVPEATKSLVLIVDDPDVPDPANPQRTWVHWVVYNIPPHISGLQENIKALPLGALAGINDWQSNNYGGPCPPIGRHRYFFKLYALSEKLPNLPEMTWKRVESEMKDIIIEETSMIGTYQKTS